MDPVGSNISLYLGWGILLLGVILVMLIVLMRSVSSLKQAAASQVSAAPSAASAPPARSSAPVTQRSAGNEVVAVIAAAVAAYMEDASPGVPYQIASVTPAAVATGGAMRRTGSRPVWGFAGMRQNTEPF